MRWLALLFLAAPAFAQDEPVPAPEAAPAFPTEALGFRFGSSMVEAEAACGAGGGRWDREIDASFCSRPASDIGHAGGVLVGACGGTVCRVHMVLDATGDAAIAAAIADLRGALVRRYGDASIRTRGAEWCVDQAAIENYWCVGQGDASVTWEWAPGDGYISLRVARIGPACRSRTTAALRSRARPTNARCRPSVGVRPHRLLRRMETQELEGVAREVLERGGMVAPVDPVALARALNVEVHLYPGHEAFVDLLRRIVYMPSRPMRRTRFCGALLHELGHLALRDHRHDARDERSARYLAGAIGVPRETLDRQLRAGWSLRRLRDLHSNASNEMLARRVTQLRSAVATVIDGGKVTARVASPWLDARRVAPVRVWELGLVARALEEGEVDEGTTVAKHAGSDRVVIVTERWASDDA